jgi:hypothetical protein
MAAGAKGREGWGGATAVIAFPPLPSPSAVCTLGRLSALTGAGGRVESNAVTCFLAVACSSLSWREISRRAPDIFAIDVNAPADSRASADGLAWAVLAGDGADGSGAAAWGGFAAFPAGAGVDVTLEISCCRFHMSGCKTTTMVSPPNTAAIAPQRRTGQGFHRRPAATRTGGAIAASVGMERAAISRQSAHWLRWVSTCVRSFSVSVFSTKAASRLASGCRPPWKSAGPPEAPEDSGA